MKFSSLALSLGLVFSSFAHAQTSTMTCDANSIPTPVGCVSNALTALTYELRTVQCLDMESGANASSAKAHAELFELAQATHFERSELLLNILKSMVAGSNIEIIPTIDKSGKRVEGTEVYDKDFAEFAIGMSSKKFIVSGNGRRMILRFAAVSNAPVLACKDLPGK